MNAAMQNFIGAMIFFGPVILAAAYIIWYKASGRAAAARERKRDREIEIQMRLGMADQAAIQRVASKIASEGQ